MADTQRATNALLNLLADNTSGAISEQDLRDALVSVLGGYGSVYVADGVTSQAVTAAAAKLEAFAADGPASGVTPAHADDSLTPLVTADYWVEFGADVSADVGGEFTFELRLNGAAAGGLKSTVELEAAGETRHAGFAGPISLTANDVVTVYVSGAVGNLTVRHGRLALKRIG